MPRYLFLDIMIDISLSFSEIFTSKICIEMHEFHAVKWHKFLKQHHSLSYWVTSRRVQVMQLVSFPEFSGAICSKRTSLNQGNYVSPMCVSGKSAVSEDLVYDTAKMPRHDFLIGPMDPARWRRPREASAETNGKEARWAELKERLVG